MEMLSSSRGGEISSLRLSGQAMGWFSFYFSLQALYMNWTWNSVKSDEERSFHWRQEVLQGSNNFTDRRNVRPTSPLELARGAAPGQIIELPDKDLADRFCIDNPSGESSQPAMVVPLSYGIALDT